MFLARQTADRPPVRVEARRRVATRSINEGGGARRLALVLGLALTTWITYSYAVRAGVFHVAALLLLVTSLAVQLALAIRSRLRALVTAAPGVGRWQKAGKAVATGYFGLLAVAIWIAVPRVDLTVAEARAAPWELLALFATAMLAVSIERPARRPLARIAFHGPLIVLLSFDLLRLVIPRDPELVLGAPFREAASVVQGGPSLLVNHHHAEMSQRYAVDLVLAEHATGHPRTSLEEFPCYRKPVLSGVAGKVVAVANNHRDQPLGSTDQRHFLGNHVVVQPHGAQCFVLYAHLAAGSVAVTMNQAVQAGDVLGQCGNSGNSTEPHLHLQLQDRPTFEESRVPRSLPFAFATAAGPARLPRRNDTILGDSPARWQLSSSGRCRGAVGVR